VKDYEGRDALAVSIRQKEVIRKAMGRQERALAGAVGVMVEISSLSVARWLDGTRSGAGTRQLRNIYVSHSCKAVISGRG
jgi:hypothetical protein